MLKKIFVLLTTVTILGLAGCNTINGVGKDISAGGKAIQKAAQ